MGTETQPGLCAPPRREGRRSRPDAVAALLCALALCGAVWGCGPGSGEPEPEPAPPTAEPGEPTESAAAELFEGAWFTIEAPPGFTARPSLTSETAEGLDSVFFDSQDGRVTFYVCSPQWGRQPVDVERDPATETLVSESVTERGEATVRQLEIAARDGSYERLLEVFFSPVETTQWAFGFRWADREAHQEYLWRYEEFKESIEQYAD